MYALEDFEVFSLFINDIAIKQASAQETPEVQTKKQPSFKDTPTNKTTGGRDDEMYEKAIRASEQEFKRKQSQNNVLE